MYDPQYLPATPTNEVEWLMQRGSAPDLNDVDHINAVIKAVESLKEVHRIAIEGYFYERISYAKLAERLGCSKPHAWRITQKAMRELHRQLRVMKPISERYNMFDKWEDAMYAVLEILNDGAVGPAIVRHKRLDPYKNELIRIVNSNDDLDSIPGLLMDMGLEAIAHLKNNKQWDFHEMGELLIKKQHDYGHDNILNFGQIGLAIRICDKVARLYNLADRQDKAANESVTDTWVDIVGYSVLSIMLDNGTFELPLGGKQ